MNIDSAFIRDLAERAISTYIQALIGILMAAGLTSFDVSVIQSAAVAALPAALSVVKSALAKRYGSDDISPASLAK